MLGKLLAPLAALTMLAATPAPAIAEPEIFVSIHFGNKHQYKPYHRHDGRDRYYRPRCSSKRFVIVEDRYGRLFCISKRDYFRYYYRYDRPRYRVID